ncbi:ATP-dependent zinc metalloprotease FtsH [Variovorax sp. PBS-H4]|uniref:ATP-dependent metallopeptidase FtsH/Yme1/Tma family protein n=1 Tax=Variovorax sp. PBS-H4 TaxID=434008 RepID=UPI0013160E29|nr:AAA family ATPase [Variovorax sp. PBS-H4]VTU31455.1 ATP-dependent zinc metalloprotease FtsH [Variovorax sp. PBS-H4]
MKHFHRLLRSKPRLSLALVLAFAALAVAAVFLLLRAPAVHPLDRPAQAMRSTPEAWTAVEKDGSDLLRDLRAGHVGALGLAPNALLVSTTRGERYFVVDARGSFAALAISQAQQADARPFQLVVLPDSTVGAPAADSRALTTARDLAAIFLPLFLLALVVYTMRDSIGGGAKLVEKPAGVGFDDVIGAGEAKHALQDIVDYLKDPSRYRAIGARAPCGVLMLGGPGVGKTLLAKALAGECGANFIATNGSEFTSKFYGVGVQKVKKLFETARKNAPCILFIDELDGISKRTSSGAGPAESESNRIINQLLVEMDGFEANEGVIVVGATNLEEHLDEALLREGRFDRRVHVKLPDVRDRCAIFRLYTGKLRTEGSIDHEQLARLTTGLSPATIAHIVNHAALVAARGGSRAVAMTHLMEAIETTRIGELNGAQRALGERERRYIAVHEAGHALVSAVLGYGKVEKVTILPRGGALGVTLVTQEEDQTLVLKSDMEKHIQMLLGGRNAELAVFDEASSGASQDLQQASRLALDMVGRYGFGQDGALFSIGALPAQHASRQISAAVRQANQLLETLNLQCQHVLRAHRRALDALTEELLAQETVPGARVLELVGARGPTPSASIMPAPHKAPPWKLTMELQPACSAGCPTSNSANPAGNVFP